MLTYIYLVVIIVLIFIFAKCFLKMVCSKNSKTSLYNFCIVFFIGLLLSQFSTQDITADNTYSFMKLYPLPYYPQNNFYVVEGLEDSSSNGSGNNSDSTSNSNCSVMSVTDKNVFLLNDRVNTLDANYQVMNSNVTTLQNQMQELMNKTTEDAANAVGTSEYNFSAEEQDENNDGSGSG